MARKNGPLFLVVMLCVAFLAVSIKPAEARGLLTDRVVASCKEYGIVDKERVCTKCENDHVLVPPGRDCQRIMAGCKDVGFEGGKQVCKVCKDDFVLAPGKDCNRKVVGRH